MNMRRVGLSGAAFVAAALLALPARAQDGEEGGDESDVEVSPAAPGAAGGAPAAAPGYAGVAPGDGAGPGRRVRHGKVPIVSWVGFQPQDGGASRVFIQLDREVPYHQAVDKGDLVVSLDQVGYANGNARRPLDTRFFTTALERITPRAARRHKGERRHRGGGIDLVIHFKSAADAREASASMSKSKDGFTYLVLEFGAPSGSADAAARAPAASAANQPE